MEYKNKIILGLSLVIMGLLLFIKPIGCNKPEHKVSKDTLSSKTIYSDTLIIHDSFPVEKPVPYAVYLAPKDGTIVNSAGDSIRVYKKEYNSKYVSIEVSDSVRGELLSNRLKYTLRIPKDCVVVTNDITVHDTIVKAPKFSLWGGLEVGGSKTTFNNASPYISATIKNKQFTYRYNLLEQTHNIGFGIKLK